MDHPITGLALLQLGKISLEAGKLDEAGRFFEEATLHRRGARRFDGA